MSRATFRSWVVSPLLVAALAGCGGGGTDEDSSSGFASVGTHCGNYTDIITSSTRSKAMADVQCSSIVLNADSYLASAKATCQTGDTSNADKIYDQYVKAANYATSTTALMCGGSGGTTLPSGTVGNHDYNYYVYVGTTNGAKSNGTCTTTTNPAGTHLLFGGVWSLVASGLTANECSARKAADGT